MLRAFKPWATLIGTRYCWSLMHWDASTLETPSAASLLESSFASIMNRVFENMTDSPQHRLQHLVQQTLFMSA
jgi:hypothetical protein